MVVVLLLLTRCLVITASGTAAKLGRTAAYHHCTLLCSADRRLLSSLLRPTCHGIHSNATASLPAPVQNLMDHDPSLTHEGILRQLAEQYLTGTCLTLSYLSHSLLPVPLSPISLHHLHEPLVHEP